MSSREHRDAAYPLSSEIRHFVLSNQLGMIPDAEEDFLSVRAIAGVLGLEVRTVQKKLPRRTTPRHPIGPFFRMSVAVKAMEQYDKKHGREEADDPEASER